MGAIPWHRATPYETNIGYDIKALKGRNILWYTTLSGLDQCDDGFIPQGFTLCYDIADLSGL